MNLRHFALRVLINAVAIAVTAALLDGISVPNDSLGTMLIIGFVFSLVNAFIKPIVTFLSCPLVVLTLGLFILIINAFLLRLTATIVGEQMLYVAPGFWTPVLGALVISIVNMLLESVLGLNEKQPPPHDNPGKRG